MRNLIISGMLAVATQGMALTIDVGASSPPIPKLQVLDSSVQIPRQGTIVAKFHDGRLIARGIDPLTGNATVPLVFHVLDLDRALLHSLNQQVNYILLSNNRRGKGNGGYPLIMELEHNGHRRWMVVRHLPRERMPLEAHSKISRYLKWLDI
jgi:hypothetical protein